MSSTIIGALAAVGVLLTAYLLVKVQRVTQSQSVRKRIEISEPIVHFELLKTTARLDVLIVIVVALLTLFLNGVGLCVLSTLVAFVVTRIVRVQQARIERRRYERMLPRIVDALVMSVRSGTGLPVAFGEAANEFEGAIGRDLSEVKRRIDAGYGFTEAIDVWTERNDSPLVRTTVVCLKLAHESGASVVSTLMSVRKTIGFSLDRVEMANTAASQARASVYVLAGLPFFVSGPMLLLNRSARQFMFHSIIGITISAAGLMLDAAGIAWMNKLVQKAQA